ncbi:hypothetical protein FD967_08050 [Polynucleobacter sp. JS-Mosq-20-D10]|uniref:hypothetical protein n=1 Tax=Polynucleobacter sp. JS-Mosq-20-D10 TaxID=2576922 RepID=UPI001BFDE036|nr:hypothetical protein [Polynucleobacter sp. JS-Mosq-20-D10]QWD99981.1 hypothetical protein FD967_08050 [Polynucleobacter sp. JS-Mosq-20-D10]
MMNCPYCLSEVAEEASVCKVCTRDLYLFKPMMAKMAELEKRLEEIPNQDAYEHRIAELQLLLDEQVQQQVEPRGLALSILDIVIYIGIPLALLLAAHGLISIVYDTKPLYLRLISIILPLPFGYFLFKSTTRKLFPWFMGVVFLAIASVIGMSWMTSIVDGSPIWPQNIFEWREVLEYSASIAFSFLTGMLLGGVAYASKQRHLRKASINPFLKAVVTGLGEGQISPSNLHGLMKKLQEYGGTIVALGTTAVSIYTGLKGIIG